MIEFDKDCKWDNFMSPNFTSARPYTRTQKAWPVGTDRTQQKEWPVVFRGERRLAVDRSPGASFRPSENLTRGV